MISQNKTEPRINCPTCGEEFIRRDLRCPSCKEIAISKLYKYVPYNQHSLSILINNKIWCPKAGTLNDPFELDFDLIEDNIPIDPSLKQSIQRQVKELGVICLTEVNNDVLMWSHYAQSHKGFCIEFNRTDDNDLGNREICLPIIYTIGPKKPSFTVKELAKDDAIIRIATAKTEEWKYEKEWRSIVKTAGRLVPLPTDINGVIFGCEMDSAKRQTIANILGSDFNYMEAVKIKGKYGLEIKKVRYDSS